MSKKKLVEIFVGERLRGLDDNAVTELAQSIDKRGLINPIIVDDMGYLVAGYHRLEAVRKLGWKEVSVIVAKVGDLEAQLIEIDENLIRKELTILEKCGLHALRKEYYESLNPEARHGGDRKSPKARSKRHDGVSKSYAQDAAEKTRQSERTVQRMAKLGKDLGPEVQELLKGSPVADRGTELKKLAKLPPETRRAVAQKIADGKATSVRVALQLLGIHQEEPPKDPVEDLEGSHSEEPPTVPAPET